MSEEDLTTEQQHYADISQNPELSGPWTELAKFLFTRGRLEEAEFAVNNALNNDAKAVEALILLGDLLAEQLRDEEAEDAYKKAINVQR